MKKFLAVLTGMLLVFGFAASAFAIHADIPSETQAVVAKGTTQIMLGGAIRVRGEMRQNIDVDKDDDTDNGAYWDQRVRLRVQADVTKNTIGVIHLESNGSTDATDEGENVSDNWTWGTGGHDARGLYPKGNAKRNELVVLEAWIQHTGTGLLGIPAGIKVGHMPLKLGYGLYFDHSKFGDDAIILFMNPTKELHVAFVYAKFDENGDFFPATNPIGSGVNVNDDANGYALLFDWSVNKDTSVSGDITFFEDQRAAFNSSGGPVLSPTYTNPAAAGNADYANFFNFGLRGSTRIAGLGIRASADVQAGKNVFFAGSDVKNRGYAFLAGVDYTFAPVKVEAEFAYGSGDDDATDNKNETFTNSLGNVQKYTYVYEYRVPSSFGATNTGIANTMYVKVGASGDIMKDLNVVLNLYWLRAAEDKVITIGSTPSAANNTKGRSKDIGTEIDGKITYKIDRNLVYYVEGGYLFTGSFYDRQNGTKADDAYAVRHGIELSF